MKKEEESINFTPSNNFSNFALDRDNPLVNVRTLPKPYQNTSPIYTNSI